MNDGTSVVGHRRVAVMVAFVVLTILPGCRATEGNEPVLTVRLQEILAIHDEGRPGYQFENVADFTVDGQQRVWVLDKGAHRLLVFDPHGELLRTIGRRGEGPGEFVNPIALALRGSDEIWVVDAGAARFTVFDTSGNFLTSYRRRSGNPSMPWPGRILASGRIVETRWHASPLSGVDAWLVPHALQTGDLLLADSSRLVLPELNVPQFTANTPAGVLRAQVPFSPAVHYTIDPSGRIWIGSGHLPRVIRMDVDGDTLLHVELPIVRRAVTDTDQAEALASLDWFTTQGGIVEPDRIPDSHPYFSGLLASPTRGLWVRLAGHEWLHVDTLGSIRARVDLALDGFPPPRLLDSVVVGLTRDSLDRPTVRVYRW